MTKMDVILHDPGRREWSALRQPLRVLSARRLDDVVSAFDEVEREVEDRGRTAVGFIAYEAAPAFDAALRTHEPSDELPLLVFGIFDTEAVIDRPAEPSASSFGAGGWRATQGETEYFASVARIRGRIAVGDTYQVNHTFRLRADFSGDPFGLFSNLTRAQPDCYAAFIDLGDLAVCSASPELFFRLEGERIVSRPMKGTSRRGWDRRSDELFRSRLARSPKDRAENAMIVDMVRNDLGRVAEIGSVEVTRRFDVERHPTVFQMTSTIEAATKASCTEIMAALFPFASITGAPKVRTMELIRDLETSPRGIYTGAIGVLRPGRRATFSVAIRTAVVDRVRGRVEYGVGSGVVWDSVARDEYDECFAKARILTEPPPEFELLETMLWTPEGGVQLLDRHLRRLESAAAYFDRPFDRQQVLERLREVPGTELRSCGFDRGSPVGGAGNSATPYLEPSGSLRVRLLLAADGTIRVETAPVVIGGEDRPVRLGLAADPVDPEDPFVHFKTTNRGVYDRARASRPECDDVLLWNTRGEVTESTIANLVARFGDELVTPPVSSGLLDGTMRAEMLDGGEITERLIRVDELADADELFLVNSVQGRRPAVLVP